jgi:hypothetical protein
MRLRTRNLQTLEKKRAKGSACCVSIPASSAAVQQCSSAVQHCSSAALQQCRVDYTKNRTATRKTAPNKEKKRFQMKKLEVGSYFAIEKTASRKAKG